MSSTKDLSFPTVPRRAARRPSKVTRGLAIAALLKELALSLDLEALIAECGLEPFRRQPALARIPARRRG